MLLSRSHASLDKDIFIEFSWWKVRITWFVTTPAWQNLNMIHDLNINEKFTLHILKIAFLFHIWWWPPLFSIALDEILKSSQAPIIWFAVGTEWLNSSFFAPVTTHFDIFVNAFDCASVLTWKEIRPGRDIPLFRIEHSAWRCIRYQWLCHLCTHHLCTQGIWESLPLHSRVWWESWASYLLCICTASKLIV